MTSMPPGRWRQALLHLAAALALLLTPLGQPGGGAVSARVGAVSVAPQAPATAAMRLADFAGESPATDARHVADWVADSRDNRGADFVIVDKRQALIYVFDAKARLRGASPVLLGSARGDHTVPGIGDRPLALVEPHERTTPAGRFVAEHGFNLQGEDVVWVDYDAAVSMHRVRTTNPRERRAERLATPTADDNRISYGCINVPLDFYESHVRPLVAGRLAIVYVLPEVESVRQVFGSYDVATHHAGVGAAPGTMDGPPLARPDWRGWLGGLARAGPSR